MSLPKRLAHYIINGLILKTTDLQNQVEKLQDELNKTKCVSCNTTFVGYELPDEIRWCEICTMGVCYHCPTHAYIYDTGEIICDNHKEDVCKMCFEEFEEPILCGICGWSFCACHIDPKVDTFDSNVCKKTLGVCSDDSTHKLKRRRGICKECDTF
jgi:hypothetical protein